MSASSFKAISSAIVPLTLGCWICMGSAMAKGPSFDCGKAEAGSIEAMICQDDGLAAMDRFPFDHLGRAFRLMASKGQGIIKPLIVFEG
jgi:uncharacterized protein